MKSVKTIVSQLSDMSDDAIAIIEKIEMNPGRYRIVSRETWVRQIDGEIMEMVRFIDTGDQPPSSSLK